MYERQIDEEFALQKEIADAIVGSLFLTPQLGEVEGPVHPQNSRKLIACKSGGVSPVSDEPDFTPESSRPQRVLGAAAGGEGK
jgi:hypothetical protein